MRGQDEPISFEDLWSGGNDVEAFVRAKFREEMMNQMTNEKRCGKAAK